jgi:hypothetical protein
MLNEWVRYLEDPLESQSSKCHKRFLWRALNNLLPIKENMFKHKVVPDK